VIPYKKDGGFGVIAQQGEQVSLIVVFAFFLPHDSASLPLMEQNQLQRCRQAF